jgi:hypothetical protein
MKFTMKFQKGLSLVLFDPCSESLPPSEKKKESKKREREYSYLSEVECSRSVRGTCGEPAESLAISRKIPGC